MGWTPTPQASWVKSFNALGDNLGSRAMAEMISLQESEVLRAAENATGFSEFGDQGFRDGLGRLLQALEAEAELSFLGRLLARQEIQRILQTRLEVQATLSARPSILHETIEQPVFVTGLARTGTTFLHELLTQDSRNRVPMLWETMYPSPPPKTATFSTDPRIERADREIRIMDEITPSFPSMHENAGDLPTECIFLLAQEFSTDLFSGAFEIPSYSAWMSTTEKETSYRAHRRLLQLLQSGHRLDRWVLKAPSHLSQLPALFAVYPDARVVITHRDPLQVLGSLTNLMATLRGMRSRAVDYASVVWQMSLGYEMLVQRVVEQRAEGLLPEKQIFDIGYPELIADPVGTLSRLYAWLDVDFPAGVLASIETFLERRPQDKRGFHQYEFADTGLDLATERAKYVNYQERYGVVSEI